MRFTQYGRTYQLAIENADDLQSVLDLDAAHWVATSAPVTAFRCDPRFLALVDADGNGRITSDEVKGAIRWLLNHVSDRSVITSTSVSLPVAAIVNNESDGETLLKSSLYVLKAGGKADETSISLAYVREFIASIQSRPLNGDGIIPPEATPDAELAEFIRDVVSAGWGTTDSNGKAGVGETHVKEFRAAVPAYLAWRQRGTLPADTPVSDVLPFGTDTAGLFGLLNQQAETVEMFFRLCHVLQFDARASGRVGGADSALQELDPTNRAVVDNCLRMLPIARPTVEAQLSLREQDINPLYHGWLAAFRDQVVQRVLGSTPAHLSETDWHTIRNALAPYAAYLREKPAKFTDAVPLDRLARYVDIAYETKALRVIAADNRVALVLKNAQQVERLILYAGIMIDFVNNFVSFPKLYDANVRAMFEMGSAVLDGRWFNLAVGVSDVAAHSATAKTGDLFVMYLDITGTATEKFSVAIPVTSGTKGNITVGKRGVFFDIAGKEYDARVSQLVENPISLTEALAAPFIKLWKLAQGKIESWSTNAEKGLQTEFDKTLTVPAAGAPGTPPVPAPPPPPPPGQPSPGLGGARPAGMFLGMGVTVAAIGSSFAFITKTFSAMRPTHLLWSFGGAALVVLLPVTLIAVLKLRRQDLSVLLEGCGWAVNARLRLHLRQRRQFTHRRAYPTEAEGIPRRRRLRLALYLILVAVSLTAGVRACRSLVRAKVEALPPATNVNAPAAAAAPSTPPTAGGAALPAESP